MKLRGPGRAKRPRGSLASFALLSFALVPIPFALSPSFVRSPASQDSEPWTVLLSGDADGYLAPCGCTSPQQGGLKRRATALRGEGRVVRLDNGGLAGGITPQDRFKAQTAAQALELAGVDAANLTARDAIFKAGGVLEMKRLSGDRIVSTSLQPSETVPVAPWRTAGPFLIGGATSRPDLLTRDLREHASSPVEAAHRLASEAASQGLAPILLFDGDQNAAATLAKEEPALRLVTYHATGRPSSKLDLIGDCAIASPGEHGKGIVKLIWRDARFVSLSPESLGPEVPDDKEAEVLYKTYLRRVSESGLLEMSPRSPIKAFAGSAKCASCHQAAAQVWHGSKHAHALKTLEDVGHERDPDCVRCHVVGKAASMPAFWSRAMTPQLADVGCESCHGGGAAHSAAPRKFHLPKIGENACKPCHTLENSPNFDFSLYWPKVKHGK